MRVMTWNLGCLVLLMWHADMVLHSAPPDWLFFTAVVFWFLAGLGSLTVAVIRLVSGKLGAGAPGLRPQARPGAPAEKREA